MLLLLLNPIVVSLEILLPLLLSLLALFLVEVAYNGANEDAEGNNNDWRR